MRTICDSPAQQQSREFFHIFQDLKSEFSLDKSIFKDLKFAQCWCLQRHWGKSYHICWHCLWGFKRVAWKLKYFLVFAWLPATKCWTQGAAQNEMYKKRVSWSSALCCADFLYCFLSVFRHHCEQQALCVSRRIHTTTKKGKLWNIYAL